MTTQTFNQPMISVDVVPLYVTPEGSLKTILGRRLYEPYLGEFALPGVLLNPDETLHEAAERSLRTKVDTPSSSIVAIQDVGAFDSTNRDPRWTSVSITYIAALQPTEEYLKELETNERLQTLTVHEALNLNLPFDHAEIITKAVETLTEKFWNSKEFTKALLGETFSTKTVRNVMLELEEFHKAPLYQQDLQNLTRKLKTSGYVSQSSTNSLGTSQGRPSSLWEWAE